VPLKKVRAERGAQVVKTAIVTPKLQPHSSLLQPRTLFHKGKSKAAGHSKESFSLDIIHIHLLSTSELIVTIHASRL
jgi:hypothetical protein